MKINPENLIESGSNTIIDDESTAQLSQMFGKTVFEVLATSSFLDIPEDAPADFKMSVTRLSTGQTVPDEQGPRTR